MAPSKIVAIIPARMASSRLPGKPLLEFHGLPMVEHVRRRAVISSAFSEVAVATCDAEIARAIEGFGGRVIMTSAKHAAATDRVAEATNELDAAHVVNVQGDEILVLPEDLSRMARAIEASPDISAWNAVASIDDRAELSDRSIVKCVVSKSNRVLFCSRDFTFLPLSDMNFDPVRKILGILAYERSFLMSFLDMSRTPLEILQSIDQLRIVESDQTLQGVDFSRGYPGINEPEEIRVVEHYLENDARQRATLEHILSL
jgi:3-deoxy-manno-octulosonate cytidylyltransferase (CMP-KDO synthetase)